MRQWSVCDWIASLKTRSLSSSGGHKLTGGGQVVLRTLSLINNSCNTVGLIHLKHHTINNNKITSCYLLLQSACTYPRTNVLHYLVGHNKHSFHLGCLEWGQAWVGAVEGVQPCDLFYKLARRLKLLVCLIQAWGSSDVEWILSNKYTIYWVRLCEL